VAAAGLTTRERDVLRLVAAGRTDREIAAALAIRPRTAEWHVANVLRKRKVGSHAGAVDAPGEDVAAGAAVKLEAGDDVVLPALVGGEVRNDGQEAASVVVAAILPTGLATPATATPAP
jgi:DNA-binding CsgD family transcriptional regulator